MLESDFANKWLEPPKTKDSQSQSNLIIPALIPTPGGRQGGHKGGAKGGPDPTPRAPQGNPQGKAEGAKGKPEGGTGRPEGSPDPGEGRADNKGETQCKNHYGGRPQVALTIDIETPLVDIHKW